MSLALRFESKEASFIEHTMTGTNPPTLPQLRDVVSRLFGTEMTILLENVPLRTSDEVLAAFEAHKVADTARRVDVLEAAIESIRCGLASSDVELKYQAIHGLWELACQPFNHRYMTYSLFEAAAAALRSPELRVQSIAAAAIWRLAEHEPTLARMNVGDLVPALLQALLPDSLPEPRSAELCVEAARDAAAAAEGAGGNSRRLRRSNTHSAPYKVLLPPQAVLDDEDEAAEPSEPSPNDLQAARAVACTGYAILEQRVWHAGGLLALLACETGKRAFQRTSVALRLLPVLEAHPEHSPAPLKAACAALLTRAAEVSPPVCKSLLEGGLEQLVRLACTSGLTDASTRQQTRHCCSEEHRVLRSTCSESTFETYFARRHAVTPTSKLLEVGKIRAERSAFAVGRAESTHAWFTNCTPGNPSTRRVSASCQAYDPLGCSTHQRTPRACSSSAAAMTRQNKRSPSAPAWSSTGA